MSEPGKPPLMVPGMPLSLEQIMEKTRQWPVDVVTELVDRILLARHGGIAPEVDAAWRFEIQRRVEEIQNGKVKGIPGEEVSARTRRIVGR